jgi:hypothetical protein
LDDGSSSALRERLGERKTKLGSYSTNNSFARTNLCLSRKGVIMPIVTIIHVICDKCKLEIDKENRPYIDATVYGAVFCLHCWIQIGGPEVAKFLDLSDIGIELPGEAERHPSAWGSEVNEVFERYGCLEPVDLSSSLGELRCERSGSRVGLEDGAFERPRFKDPQDL